MLARLSTCTATVLAVLALLPPSLLAAPSADPLPAPNPGSGPSLHFPLLRRRTRRTPEDYARFADNLRIKYNRPTVASLQKRNQKRGNVANIQTTNQDADESYYAPISVGTPYVISYFFLDYLVFADSGTISSFSIVRGDMNDMSCPVTYSEGYLVFAYFRRPIIGH